MCYPVCGMVHIKEPLLLISGFPLSLSEWSSTICLTPYNRKLSVSLNKTFPFLFMFFLCASFSTHLQNIDVFETQKHGSYFSSDGAITTLLMYLFSVVDNCKTASEDDLHFLFKEFVQVRHRYD